MDQSKKQSGFALPIAIVIVVVLIIAGGAGYYFYKTSSAEKYFSPEKTYSLYIKAMEKGDVEAYLECFTEESQEMLRPIITSERLKIEFVEFPKEAEFKVTEKTSDMAVIAIASEKVKSGILFKKEKGNWKIDLKESLAQKQRDSERVGHLLYLRNSLEIYFGDHASYPVLSDTGEDGEFLKVLIDEGYLEEVLLDPLHPKYFYEYKGTENSYTLKCYCEEEGADCDMKDGIKDRAFTISYTSYGISVEKKFTEADKEKLIEITKNLYLSFSPIIRNLGIGSKGREITITGHAETREDVLKLKEALEKIPQLTEVECPISNLVKTENIDFTFTAKFKSEP